MSLLCSGHVGHDGRIEAAATLAGDAEGSDTISMEKTVSGATSSREQVKKSTKTQTETPEAATSRSREQAKEVKGDKLKRAGKTSWSRQAEGIKPKLKEKKMTTKVRSKYTIPQLDSKGNGYRIYKEAASLWAKECEL